MGPPEARWGNFKEVSAWGKVPRAERRTDSATRERDSALTVLSEDPAPRARNRPAGGRRGHTDGSRETRRRRPPRARAQRAGARPGARREAGPRARADASRRHAPRPANSLRLLLLHASPSRACRTRLAPERLRNARLARAARVLVHGHGPRRGRRPSRCACALTALYRRLSHLRVLLHPACGAIAGGAKTAKLARAAQPCDWCDGLGLCSGGRCTPPPLTHEDPS